MGYETWSELDVSPGATEGEPDARRRGQAASGSGTKPFPPLAALRLVSPVVLLAVAILLAALLRAPIETIFAHVPINYDEGWNAFHAQRLMAGGPLYPPISPGTFLNYPPLSFYVVGLLGKAIGDYVFAGRLLALLSLFVVAGNVGFITRTLGVMPQLALLASLTFLVFVVLFYPDYVAMDDPQWFGHALQTSGLVLLVRRHALTTPRLVAVALLMAAGGLVKQDLVALPLAVTAWLLLVDHRAFWRWLAIGAAIVAVSLGTLILLHGRDFISQVLLSERNFSTQTLFNIVHLFALRLAAYVAFAVVAIVVAARDRRMWLFGIYFGLATGLGFAMITAVGVIYSALFDMTIAMMICAAVCMQWIAGLLAELRRGRYLGSAVVAVLLVLPMRGGIAGGFYYRQQLENALAAAPQWQATLNRLATAPGPVACESLALCYWAGRSSSIDFFNFGQYILRHPAFGTPTISAIADGRLAMIQMDYPDGSIRFSDALNNLVTTHYGPAQTAPTALLMPRR